VQTEAPVIVTVSIDFTGAAGPTGLTAQALGFVDVLRIIGVLSRDTASPKNGISDLEEESADVENFSGWVLALIIAIIIFQSYFLFILPPSQTFSRIATFHSPTFCHESPSQIDYLKFTLFKN
jgi:hypothetical protein